MSRAQSTASKFDWHSSAICDFSKSKRIVTVGELLSQIKLHDRPPPTGTHSASPPLRPGMLQLRATGLAGRSDAHQLRAVSAE